MTRRKKGVTCARFVAMSLLCHFRSSPPGLVIGPGRRLRLLPGQVSYDPPIVQERQAGPSAIVTLALAGLAIGAVLAIPVAVFVGFLAGVALWVVISLVTASALRIGAGRAVLRLVGGVPPSRSAVGPARLANLVESVAVAIGVPQPTLLVVQDPAPNALVTGLDPRHSTLVVTSGLLERLDCLALEAVVAYQLSIIRAGDTHRRDVAVAVWGTAAQVVPAFGHWAVRAAALEPGRDVAACGLTRYPPGLLAALEAVAEGPDVAASPVLAPLWFVPPGSADDLVLRLETMRELL